MKINYDKISRTYDNFRSYRDSEIQQIIKFGNIEKGMKLLDLGRGTGNLSIQMLDCISVNAVGIDRSLQLLEKASAKGLRVLCADADYSPLPFRSDSFDVVIGAYVIHHIINEPEHCFR
jgi:ubiquinone/menaquinone biosynthesis C-methylase UbiE